jgi:molybdopterin/thiamine biosynthesis adenylyltransferase/ubiquitin-protein ligase
MAWYDEHPDYLEEELEALASEGFRYVIDEKARSAGQLIINVDYPIDGVHHQLTCEYPSEYPYFAPKVKGGSLPPGRHLDPYSDGVCLFENEQSVWSPSDTLASVLKSQIPKIIHEHENANNLDEIEGDDGYQISGQISYEPFSVIFTEDWKIPEENDFGELTIKFTQTTKPRPYLSGYVESLKAGTSTMKCSSAFPNNFAVSTQLCRWVKLNNPPASIAGDKVLDEAIATNPSIGKFLFPKKGIDIVGLVFKEDSSKGVEVYNWVFVIRRARKLNKSEKSRGLPPYTTNIIRSDRYSLDNVQTRTPRLKSVASKKVLVVGAGALGSTVISQLARAGVEQVTIIDHDIVQAGNIPRWLLGFVAIGKPKPLVLQSFIQQNYPHVRCIPYGFHIGSPALIQQNDKTFISQHDFLVNLIRDSDLVIGCTAETNINHYLSDYCTDNKTPFIWATATQGGWGGIVGRILPDVTAGTWLDFMKFNSTEHIPSPAAEEGSDIQPVGCFSPTFTGTGFDLDHVSLMATRMAVSTLSLGDAAGYPDFDWDVGILNLWDEAMGVPIAPKWSTHSLTPFKG